ncbi:MAG TPA: hypothetical protein VLL98_04235 [Rickettsiales bacterium]|nr:hypothetical protein [Rickettsiales bacterium]
MKKLVSYSLILFTLFNTVSCGYMFYPERRNQHVGSNSKVDPGVFIMDAACLLLFIVPGVVAFSVDFTSGTLYLPSKRRAEGIHAIKIGQNIDDNSIIKAIEEEYGISIDKKDLIKI